MDWQASGAVLQSIGSVAGGFGAMVAIVLAGEALIATILRPSPTAGDRPSTAYLVLNLMAGTLAALAGGALASFVAPHSAMAHVAGLAVVVMALGMVSAIMAGNAQPRWYQAVLALGMPFVVIAGGWMMNLVG